MIKKILKKYHSLSVEKKAILWFTFATIIQNGIMFLVTPIYTRILSDSEYGVFGVYQSWQQIISIIGVLALDRCISVGFMKFAKERKEFLSSIQSLMTVLIFTCFILVCIFPNFFTSIIGLPIYVIFSMLIMALLNNSLMNWSCLQRYEYKYKKLSIITILSTLIIQIGAILAVILIPFDNKGELLILATTVGKLLIYGIIYIAVLIRGKNVFNKDFWKFSLKYSIAIIPHALAQIILNSSDRIMIDKMCSREEAAYYSVTYSAAMVLNIVITAISSAVQPWFFERIKNKEFNKIKERTRSLFLISALLVTIASLFAPDILAILAPGSYSAALWVFPSIAVGVFFNSLYLYFANFESYYEKPYYYSIATGIGAVVNIMLNFLLIPIFGFIAAGYTTLFCYIIFAILHYVFMRRVCKKELDNVKPFDAKFTIILSVVTVLSSILITLLYMQNIVRYIFIAILFVGVFILRKKILKSAKK